MTTTQTWILAGAVVLIVLIVLVAQARMRMDQLASEERRERENAVARAESRQRDADRAEEAVARRALGPVDGTKVAVHIGPNIIRGTRVRRGEPDTDGWIVLDGAEMIVGERVEPLGGRQWLRDSQWLQEFS